MRASLYAVSFCAISLVKLIFAFNWPPVFLLEMTSVKSSFKLIKTFLRRLIPKVDFHSNDHELIDYVGFV